MIEHILTIPRAVFDSVGTFQGFSPTIAPYLSAFFADDSACFLPRPAAEDDPTHKQLIPYCVFVSGGKVLKYQRGGSGGEKRLTAKYSIGVGGHINPVDFSGKRFDLDAYEAAVQRELKEEVVIVGDIISRKIVGLINDDSNPVGRVHLGVVEVFELSEPSVAPNEDAILAPEFVDIDSLLATRDAFETWSQIAMDNLFATERK